MLYRVVLLLFLFLTPLLSSVENSTEIEDEEILFQFLNSHTNSSLRLEESSKSVNDGVEVEEGKASVILVPKNQRWIEQVAKRREIEIFIFLLFPHLVGSYKKWRGGSLSVRCLFLCKHLRGRNP